MIVAACFGALFGEHIVHSTKPYYQHVFFWAFFMVIAALPFYTLGLLYLLKEDHANLVVHASLTNIMHLYLLVLAYSFILAGVWLAVVAGFAAMYLRGHLVYYILQSINQRRKNTGALSVPFDNKEIQQPKR